MKTILRTCLSTSFRFGSEKAVLQGKHLELVRHGVTVHSHLLPPIGEFTFGELADQIRKGYSMDVPQNLAVVEALELADVLFQS